MHSQVHPEASRPHPGASLEGVCFLLEVREQAAAVERIGHLKRFFSSLTVDVFPARDCWSMPEGNRQKITAVWLARRKATLPALPAQKRDGMRARGRLALIDPAGVSSWQGLTKRVPFDSNEQVFK